MKKIIFTLFFYLFWSTNVLSAPVIHKQTVTYDNGNLIAGVAFSDDGKKVFTTFANKDDTVGHHINEFNLTVPYDISTGTYAGDGERCLLDQISTGEQVYDLEIKDSGKKLFVTTRGLTTVEAASRLADNIFRYDLETAFDISTCAFSHKAPTLETEALDLINGSNAGNVDLSTRFKRKDHRLQGIDLSPNGKKMFLSWFNSGDATRLLEYDLNTPFDLTTMSLVTSAGIPLTTSDDNGVNNAAGISFSTNGKRIFIVSHAHNGVARITQISLKNAFDTSAFTIDGNLAIDQNGSLGDFNNQPRGIDFSPSGLKMYVGNDHDDNIDEIMEYDLACPFNIFEGRCPEITDDKERTAIAEAQVELARRTFEHSSDTVLKRLDWIKRNKEKQNLTNLKTDFQYPNQMFATLANVVKANLPSMNSNKKSEVFYWSEGSIAFGKIGETTTALSKDIKVNSLTYGADIKTQNENIRGLALRYGSDKTKITETGSHIDANTLNLTLYNSSPFKTKNKFLETIIGVGLIDSNILTVLETNEIDAHRTGKQVYATLRAKEEFYKNDITLIHSGQLDYGFTKFENYLENLLGFGTGALYVEDQYVKSGNIRTSLTAVHSSNNKKNSKKKHLKLEYQATFDKSSNFEYKYVSNPNQSLSSKINTHSYHNINGEIGLDMNFDPYSIFVIYERNQSLDYGYIDQIHFSLGYLPDLYSEYLFSLKGSENLSANFDYKKNINNSIISLNIANEILNSFDNTKATFEVKSIF